MKKLLALFLLLPFLASAQRGKIISQPIYTNPTSSSGSGSVTNIKALNTLYVSTSGNDGTAAIGNPGLPWASIGAAISNAPNNSIIWIYPATYNVTPTVQADGCSLLNPIMMQNKTNITVIGNGAVIEHGNNNGTVFGVWNSDAIAIQGLNFHGNKQNPGGTLGGAIWSHIKLFGTNQNVMIDDCKFYGSADHNISTASSTCSSNINVTITRCWFENSGYLNGGSSDGAGVAVSAMYLTVRDCYFTNHFRGVECEGSTKQQMITIDGNRFVGMAGEPVCFLSTSPRGSFTETNWSRVSIVNNHFQKWDTSGFSVGAIQINDGMNYTIANNTFDGTTGSSTVGININYQYPRSIIISGNIFESITQYGVDVNNQSAAGPIGMWGLTVEGNIFNRCGAGGVRASGNNLIIKNNQIFDAGYNFNLHWILVRNNNASVPMTNVIVSGNILGDRLITTGTKGISVESSYSGVVIDNNLTPARGTFIPVTQAGKTGTSSNYVNRAEGGYMQIAPPTLTGSSITPSLDISQTWNTSGAATGLKLNVTDTASSAQSVLVDFELNGTSKFAVTKSGTVVKTSEYLGWYDFATTPDVTLYRDAADTLALRRGATAQALRVYNTYTDSSNYEYGGVYWSGNSFVIGTLKAGTGSSRPLVFAAGGTSYWFVAAAGNFYAVTDNISDIGASGANRPRSIYVGTSVRSPKFETAASVQWTSGTGSPESVVTANIGSIYTRTDGGAGTTLYIKESGTGTSTGWVAK